MSRLYDIIRQMEENSQKANITQQEMILLDSGKSNPANWWRSYRVIILIAGITLTAVVIVTIGSRGVSQLLNTQKSVIVASIRSISSPSASEKPGDSNVRITPESAALVGSKKSEEIEKPVVETRKDVEANGNNQIAEVAEQKSQAGVKAKNPEEKIPEAKRIHAKKAYNSSKEKQTSKTEIVPRKEPPARTEPGKQTSNSMKQEEKPFHVLPVQSGIITMAEEARKKGNIEEAIRLYKQYISLHRDPLVMNNLGALLISKGQLNDAEELLREAFQMAPDDDIVANLIGVEMMLGKSREACEVLNKVKEIKPEYLSKFKSIVNISTCDDIR